MRRLRALGALALALLLLATSCGGHHRPDLGSIYNRAAQAHGPERNPVIVIPGILGSKLNQAGSERIVWGAFGATTAKPSRPDDARLIALPMEEGTPLRLLRDDVETRGVLDRVKVHLMGIPFVLRAYVNILALLGVGGYRDESFRVDDVNYGEGHFTCFQFPYDWRRDISESAVLLHEFIEAKRVYVQAELEQRYGVVDAEVRFDIVAHSMGALVARYYARYGGVPLPDDGSLPELTWAGAANLDNVILVGPPNAGAGQTIFNLVDGLRPAPTLPLYDAAILGTMPAIYQLLPRERHAFLVDDTGQPVKEWQDIKSWEKNRWGLLDPDLAETLAWLLPEVDDAETRRRIARDHVEKNLRRAHQFFRAMDRPGTPPTPVRLHLVAGDAEPTLAQVSVDTETGRITKHGDQPGDGTVLRTSALFDERVGSEWTPGLITPITWSNVLFIFNDHVGLTRDPAFSDNVLFILLEDR